MICSKCCIEKDPDKDFYHRKQGRNNVCKNCKRAYQRIYENTDVHLRNAKDYERRNRKREFINNIKNKPCVDCAKIYEPFCMDFDHVRGSKIDAISNLIHNKLSNTRILEEIAKTELVCALCHAFRTYKRAYTGKTYHSKFERNRALIVSLKTKPCAMCSIQYHACQMQFDHLRDKTYNVSTMFSHTEDEIIAEANKCQILCILCHRRKTHSL